MARIFRQGDILVREVAKVPGEAQKQLDNVIAVGEATGHKHELLSGESCIFEKKNSKFLVLLDDTDLIHPEHDTIKLPTGKFEIVREREYDPYEKLSRTVMD